MQSYDNTAYQTTVTQPGNIIIQTQPPNVYMHPPNVIIQTQQPQYTQAPPQYASNHVIISSQPVGREWSHDLCNCADDCLDCLYAHYCTLCYSVQLGSMHNEHCCTIFCCRTMALISLRTKIRTERNIQGTIGNDIMTMLCCHDCALIQMKKETLEQPTGIISVIAK